MTFIGLFFLFVVLSSTDAQNTCTDRRAICIHIRQCPSVIAILKGPNPLSQETVEAIRALQCGGYSSNDPFVCCILEQTTPSPIITDTSLIRENANPPDVTNHPNLRFLDHRCGPFPHSIIFRGNKTEFFEYPWMALLMYNTGKLFQEFLCGGTIITNRYILTAAHCITALSDGVALVGVRVGEHDLTSERECVTNENGLEILCAERYQEFSIESTHFHPEYNRTTLENDIALIRLNDTVDFRSGNVYSICLPIGSAANTDSRRMLTLGWGATKFGLRSQVLLYGRLPLVNNEQCREIYKDVLKIGYKQICAGNLKNSELAFCPSDSGGPLLAPGIYNDNSVRAIQYGVFSFGMTVCDSDSPGVYTNVSYYLDWILNTMTD